MGWGSHHMIVGPPSYRKPPFLTKGDIDNSLWCIQRESTLSIKGTDAQLLKHVSQTVDLCSTHACCSPILPSIGPQWWTMARPCWSGRGSVAPHRSQYWAHSSCDWSPVTLHPLHTPGLEEALVLSPQLHPHSRPQTCWYWVLALADHIETTSSILFLHRLQELGMPVVVLFFLSLFYGSFFKCNVCHLICLVQLNSFFSGIARRPQLTRSSEEEQHIGDMLS